MKQKEKNETARGKHDTAVSHEKPLRPKGSDKNTFKCRKQRTVSPGSYIKVKTLFRNKGEIKTFLDERK